jgi:hypothetical protein
VRLSSVLAPLASLALVGCVDTRTCHTASAWKPCPGQTAQPGASGTPPTIVALSLPTCAYLDTPQVMGMLHVSDPDGDAQVVKATFFTGARSNESEVQLPDSGRSGNEWSGTLSLTLVGGNGGMLMEGSNDVVVKVTDRAGGQSVPFCNSIAVVR